MTIANILNSAPDDLAAAPGVIPRRGCLVSPAMLHTILKSEHPISQKIAKNIARILLFRCRIPLSLD
jgi:hypothetical protein